MSVKIEDLMTKNTICLKKHETVAHARSIFQKNKINSLPVAGEDDVPVGIVSTSDLISEVSDTTPVSSIMTEKVYTIAKYSDPQLAAKMMRKHKIHHLVVTHEKSIVGVVSSFDLLTLVEGQRYIEKNQSTPKKHKGKRNSIEA
jgi:predicted transcriptional regulator